MPSTTSSHGSEAESDPPVGPSDALGYRFDDPELLRLALRHRSWCAENDGVESNERLEFLGDSVLGLVITDYLYGAYPGAPEGVLARRRAELVSTVMLAEVARELDLGSAIRLGRGEAATGGREKASILADTLEALFGAVHLDGGFDAATEVIVALFRERISDVAADEFTTDHKSRLQELAAQRYGELPEYELAGSGPEHAKMFTASVTVNGCVRGTGEGRTKKQAEQHAAEVAYDRLADTTDGRERITAPNGDEDA
ncbi:MAG: ribonuclease III [Microthrixaceae bacterium]|nr:ribonuclease III [Microthrixaceae bacterium]